MKYATLLAVSICALFVSACTGPQGPAGPPGPQGMAEEAEQPFPKSTLPVVEHEADCSNQYQDRSDGINYNHDQCQAQNPSPNNCDDERQKQYDDSRVGWLLCMKELPAVSSECRNAFNPDPDSKSDADGDGLTDYTEVQMKYNPCEKCSFGGTPGVDCDADEDWDNDGVPNGKDSSPICTDKNDPLLVTYCV